MAYSKSLVILDMNSRTRIYYLLEF